MSSIHDSLHLSHHGKAHPHSTSLPMHSGIFFIGVLSLICWGVQLLPVISVPITGKGTNYSLNLSHYNNITFGVFGVCDTVHHTCSSPKIGYTDNDLMIFSSGASSPDAQATLTEVQLPSNVTHLISKLLVLHVVAFGFTCLLLLQSISVLLADSLHERHQPKALFTSIWHRLRPQISSSDESVSSSSTHRLENKKIKLRKRNHQQLTLMFVFAVLSFLSSLLAFLADFVLFVPELGPLGWIQMLPVSIMAVIASLSCFLKRSILSRRHLTDSAVFVDEMRSKHAVFVEWDDDLQSEDGVFIYSNGFDNEHKHEDGDTSASIHSGLPIPRGSLDTELQSLGTSHRTEVA